MVITNTKLNLVTKAVLNVHWTSCNLSDILFRFKKKEYVDKHQQKSPAKKFMNIRPVGTNYFIREGGGVVKKGHT